MAKTPEKILMMVYQTQPTDRSIPVIATTPQGGPHGSFDDDKRMPVDSAHICQGGECRAIAKIVVGTKHSCKRKGKSKSVTKWTAATAWLTKLDLLVTCAHCVVHTCEHCHKLWPATHIKTYLGYTGKGSVGDTDKKDGVEFRSAKSFTFCREYLPLPGSKANSTYDVAVIKLEKRFEYVEPLAFDATPVTSKVELWIAGFPKDKDAGQRMYEQRKKEQAFDLRKGSYRMLEHRISTDKGQSGSPVFSRSSPETPWVVIGIHQGYSSSKGVNRACAIAGSYGVPLLSYALALEEAEKQPEFKTGRHVVVEVDFIGKYGSDKSFESRQEADVLELSDILSGVNKALKGLQEEHRRVSTSTISGKSPQFKERLEKYLDIAIQRVKMASYAVEEFPIRQSHGLNSQQQQYYYGELLDNEESLQSDEPKIGFDPHQTAPLHDEVVYEPCIPTTGSRLRHSQRCHSNTSARAKRTTRRHRSTRK